MKKVVRLVPEAGTGTCCGSRSLRAPLAGRGGRITRRADDAERWNCAGGWWLMCAVSGGPPGKKRLRGNYRDVGLVPEAGTRTFCATGNLRCALGRAGRKALRSRGLCGEAELRGRVVIVVRVERGAAREEKRERKLQGCGAGARGWNEDVLRHWQPSFRPWPGGEEDRSGRGDCAVGRHCAGGWWWFCAASVGPPVEREREK